jgi:hexokinase
MLFDWIADAILGFLVENGISGGLIGSEQLLLGFTFSFPVDQTAVNVGTLMHWNKGFSVSGVVHENVVALLDAANLKKVSFFLTYRLISVGIEY